jgi:glycosyltransferase involved in cell wall biosynthesis
MAGPSVLLTTEGTYPFHKGGVSTWCDALISQLSEVDFTLLALTMHPYLKTSYPLRPNVRQLVTVPLWGIEQPAEFRPEVRFPALLEQRWRTTEPIITEHFLPHFAELLRGVTNPGGPPEPVAASILAMHEYFQIYDYDTTLRSRPVWEALLRAFAATGPREACPAEARKSEGWDPSPIAGPTVAEAVKAQRLLYHLFQPLSLAVPRSDVVHSSAAAFCGLPCIVAKLKYGTPFLLTEHGVYIREQYLALRRSIKSPFVRRFMCGLVNLVAALNYRYADLVSPVCAYNARWEEWWGVPRSRIRVIFNGADPKRFSPGPPAASDRPVVCTIGLIYPLKGQLDLIAAAAFVREQIPNVEFRFYGHPSDEAYFAACRQSVAARGLERTVTFAGQTATPWQALREADVVAAASISEAFPYSIIEAMLVGSAIVSTDVGGVREALADTGVLVPPRQPRELAAAIVSLLQSPAQRRRLGQAARARALQHFTDDVFAAGYRQAYQELASGRLLQLPEAV